MICIPENNIFRRVFSRRNILQWRLVARKFFRAHWPALLLALLVSVIYGAHHFLVPFFLDGAPYFPIVGGDDMFYGARARAVFNGDWLVGDIALSGNQGGPAWLSILSPLLLGILGNIFGSLENAYIISDFLFPPLIFIAIYFLAREFSKGTILPLIFASIFIFAPKIVLFPSVSSLSFFTDSVHNLFFSRIDYPKLTFLFYVLTLLFTVRALKGKWKYDTLVAGVGFGSLFYTYLYDWVYVFIGISLALAFFFFRRQFKEVRTLLSIIFIGTLVSSFYWFNFFALQDLSSYADIVKRVGVEVSHRFRFDSVWKSYLRIVVFVGALWFIWTQGRRGILQNQNDRDAGTKRTEQGNTFIFLAGLLIAYVIAVNLQIITGFNPQPDHWYREQFLPLGLTGLVIVTYIYNQFLSRVNIRYIVGAGMVALAIIYAQGFHTRAVFSSTLYERFTLPQEYVEAYQWLDTNIQYSSTIASVSLQTLDEIQLHTGHKVFVPNGIQTIASEEEVWNRFAWVNRLYGVSPNVFGTRAYANTWYLFHMRYRSDKHDTYFFTESKDVAEEYRNEFNVNIDTYKEVLSSPAPFSQSEVPYRLDYLIFGPRESALGNDPETVIQGLKTVYEKNKIKIYEFAN